MEVVTLTNFHLVKNEDLNHHGTLYAGRTAEWFVEAGFIAAADLTAPERVVCLKIHGMTFTAPVHRGEVVKFESKIIDTGKSRLIAYIKMTSKEKPVVEGFITFIYVDQEGHAQPHGLTITPTSAEDLALQEKARALQ